MTKQQKITERKFGFNQGVTSSIEFIDKLLTTYWSRDGIRNAKVHDVRESLLMLLDAKSPHHQLSMKKLLQDMG